MTNSFIQFQSISVSSKENLVPVRQFLPMASSLQPWLPPKYLLSGFAFSGVAHEWSHSLWPPCQAPSTGRSVSETVGRGRASFLLMDERCSSSFVITVRNTHYPRASHGLFESTWPWGGYVTACRGSPPSTLARQLEGSFRTGQSRCAIQSHGLHGHRWPFVP